MSVNLFDFCAKSDPRSYMEKPFNLDGKTMATNGHILVAINELIIHDNLDAANKLRKGIEMFCSHEFGEFYSLPMVDFEKHKCETCQGCGISHYCDECEGEGVLYFQSDFNSYCCNCISCASKNHPYCVRCDGKGYGAYKKAIVFSCNGVRSGFNAGYIRLVSMLENVKVSLSKEHKEMKFIFDQGFGFLMPLNDKVGFTVIDEFILG